MELLTRILAFLATLSLGLMTGALLAEGAILVPFWKSSAPDEFFVWYRKHAALLQNFFGPLEIGATAVTAAGAAAAWAANSPIWIPLTWATALAFAVLAVFPLYFQAANTSFRHGTIAPGRLGGELRTWYRWHCARTTLSFCAFCSAAAGL